MNEHHDETEWTDDEQRALDELPRESAPSELLEHRIVGALRTRELLGPKTKSVHRSKSTRWLPQVAAALVLFLTGLAAGQWLGARSTATAFVAAHHDDAELAAMRVQEAGSAYVASLVALTALEDDGSQEARQRVVQGQQVALATLEAASAELLRLDPDNATLDRMARQLGRQLTRDASSEAADSEEPETRKVIWF